MESLEALWSIKFYDADNPGNKEDGGVVVFETQRIFGGDSAAYYIGSFNTKDGFEFSVKSKLHNDKGVMIIPEKKELTLHARGIASGSIKSGEFSIVADIKEVAGAKLGIDLKRLVDLP